MSTRTERVADEIRQEVARIITRELKDPRVGFVTVTGARITADLRSVRLFVSVLAENPARQEALRALNHAAGFFRRALFRNLRLRHAPEVTFEIDESLERGDRIERLLRGLHGDEAEVRADEEE
jgi:ribosome-binding factor A